MRGLVISDFHSCRNGFPNSVRSRIVDWSATIAQKSSTSPVRYSRDLGDYRQRDRLGAVTTDVESDRRVQSLERDAGWRLAERAKLGEHAVGTAARAEHADVGSWRLERTVHVLEISLVVVGHHNDRGSIRELNTVGELFRR
jgi:hypothetical protein